MRSISTEASLKKQLSIYGVLIMVLLGSGIVTYSVAAQAKRERRVTKPVETSKEQQGAKPSPAGSTDKQQPKPDSTPAQAAADPQQQQEKPPVKAKEAAPEPEAEPIRINSNLVAVPVSITDENGNPVRNLKADDFELEEEGQIQQVQTLGEPGKAPIELALLFDVSRSVRNRFDFEREAASRFLKEVIKIGDTVSVFLIGSSTKLSVPRSDNVDQVINGTQSIEPTDEATAFHDSIVKAARYLDDNANPGTRRVMVVISDGEDTNSERFRLGDALTEIQRSDALFYAINPSGPSIRLNRISTKGHEGMVRIASETGGMAFLPDKLEDLTRVFSQITAELQAQYLLGYYSTNEKNDGKFRRISVKVPKHSELRIRARQGYYAPKE
ncbi:MAG: VWA domain-containing protein [Acidobacteria bacterium]|nr:VWA domain-containing protein [Acidobacteriota bacterium]